MVMRGVMLIASRIASLASLVSLVSLASLPPLLRFLPHLRLAGEEHVADVQVGEGNAEMVRIAVSHTDGGTASAGAAYAWVRQLNVFLNTNVDAGGGVAGDGSSATGSGATSAHRRCRPAAESLQLGGVQ